VGYDEDRGSLKTRIRRLSGLVLVWLAVELVVFLIGTFNWFGPNVVDAMIFYLGLAAVAALAVTSTRDRDRPVAERQLVTRLVAASILTAAATTMVRAGPSEYGTGTLAVLVMTPAVVLTIMAVVSYLRYVRGDPVSGPSAAWRVAGAVLIVLIGLPISLLAGALAGLSSFSCSGGVMGEGCGGGSWLAAIIVWAVLGFATLWSVWFVATSRDRSSTITADR
jgi:hypothetical protein